jgi:hypothetical protein
MKIITLFHIFKLCFFHLENHTLLRTFCGDQISASRFLKLFFSSGVERKLLIFPKVEGLVFGTWEEPNEATQQLVEALATSM